VQQYQQFLSHLGRLRSGRILSTTMSLSHITETKKYEELTFLATLSVVTWAAGTTATDDTDTTYYEQNSNGHTDANYNW